MDAHKNLAVTLVAVAPTPPTSGTSLTVADPSVFPAVPFNVTICPADQIPTPDNAEIARVTNITGSVLTIVRQAEVGGLTARAIQVGDLISNSITVKVITDIEGAIPSTAGLISAVNILAGTQSSNVSAFTFSNSNGVSFGLSNGVITGTVATNYQSQGAYLTTAMASNRGSDFVQSNAVFAGTNASGTIASNGISVSVASQTPQTVQSNKVSAGTLSALRTDLTLADSNGVSFGLNTNGVVTATVATNYQSSGAYLTTAAQSNQVVNSINGSTGEFSFNTGSSLSSSRNGNSITFGLASNITTALQSTGAYLTTAMQSNAATISNIKVSAGTLSSLRSDLTFSNANGLSFGLETNGIITASYTVPSAGAAITVSDAASSGTIGRLAFTNLNGVTLSLSTGAGGSHTIVGSHNALTTAMASNAATISNIKVSAGTLSALRSDLTFSNSNGLSFGLETNGVITGSYTVPAAGAAITISDTATSGTIGRLAFTNLNGVTLSISTGAGGSHTIVGSHNAITTARASTDAIGLNTAQSNVTWTVNSSGISIDARGYAGTVTGATGASVTVNSSGVSINLPAYLTTADLSANSSKYVQNWKLTGNTSGTTSSAQGTDLWVSGGNGITVSGSSNSIVLSIGNYITTADLSQNSSKYVQNWKLTGNTAGTTSSAQGTDFWISGGQGITVSGSSNSIVLSVGSYITTAMASNRGSDFVAATAAFAGTNASGTIASNGISVSVAAGAAVSVSDAATSGTIGRLAFTNLNGVTLSLSTGAGGSHTIVGSHNAITTADLSQNSSNYARNWKVTGNTSGTTSSAIGTDLWLSGGNGVTISGSSNSLVFSVATNYLTTAAQSNQVVNSINGSTGIFSFNTGSSLSSSRNGNSITWGLASDITTALQSTGAYLTTADLSQNSSKYLQVISISDNVLGTTSWTIGTGLKIRVGNSMTLSGSSDGALVLMPPIQSVQTIGMIMSNGNTTGQSSSSTYDARVVGMIGLGNISVGNSGTQIVISGASAAPSPVNFSAGTTSNNLGSVVFSNSNGVSFGLSGSTITGTVSTYVTTSFNTVGVQTTGYPVASANSVGTVTRWAAEDHRHAGIGAVGISTAGNTAGTTGSQVGTYWFQANNDITLSQITSNNGSHTLILSGPPPISMYANIPNLVGMVTGASGITQTSGSSIFIQPFTICDPISVSYLRMLASFNDSAVATAGTPVANSTFTVDRYTTIGLVIYSNGVGASSNSLQSYTTTSGGITGRTILGAGAQSSQYTVTLQKTHPQTGANNVQYTTSYNVSSASFVISSNSNTLFTGPRFIDIPFAISLQAGVYWLGVGGSTSSATTGGQSASMFGTNAMPITLAGVSQSNVSVGLFGAATSASAFQLFPGLGMWSTNVSLFSKDSIGLNSISQVVSNPQLPFWMIRQN